MAPPFLLRMATALLLGLSPGIVPAQQPAERALNAERRALEAERRAVAAERRALESEQRALEAQRNASGGSSQQQAPVLTPAQACQVATSNYQAICSTPSRDSIGDAPECAAAQLEMRRRCGS